MHTVNAMGVRLRGLADALASVLFPAPCRICGETLETASRIPICPPCLASLRPYDGPLCDRCGRPIVSPVVGPALADASQPSAGVVPKVLCLVCRRGLYDFDFARSHGAYTDSLVRAVILLKYHGVSPLGGWFSQRLIQIAAQHPALREVDAVVPVPQHSLRLRERGYNHAELVARPLGRCLGVPCRSDLLVRIRPRPEKLRLTIRERWRSVRGAYSVQKSTKVDNLRVLLVDDVFTTGATLDACSRALRSAGASYVAALTVARAILRGPLPSAERLSKEPYQ
jgi:ComF family protein